MSIYLDNNATTVIDPEVLRVMWDELKGDAANSSSVHQFGRIAKAKLIQASRSLAHYFSVKEQDIFFTSGATEALNMLIKGAVALRPGHIISSVIEHPAVYQTLKFLADRGHKISFLQPFKNKGAIDPEQVASAIQPDTQLICLMAANNETGVVTDLPAIASIAKMHNIPLIVDGVALLGKKQCTIPDGVSAICFSGHKIHGPHGIGLAIVHKNLKWEPFLFGGPQQHQKRAGTENIASIIGLAKAIELIDKNADAIEYMQYLRDRFELGLKQNLTGIIVNGAGDLRVCNTSNIAFDGVEGETLLFKLDLAGIAVSHGSACSSGTLEPSRVLLGMGLSAKQVRSSLRFSLSRFTTQQEIDKCIDITCDLVRQLRL